MVKSIHIIIAQVFIVGIVLMLTNCSENHFESDVSGVKADVQFHRFDKDIRDFNTNNSDSLIKKYKQEYGYFFEVFNRQILQIGPADSPNYAANLENFVLYNEAEGIFDAVDNTFGNFSKESEAIEKMLRHYKLYFPTDALPKVVLFLSGFNHSVVTAENYLGIALDKYLGAESPYYAGADNYIRRRMDKAYLLTDAAAALAEAKYPAKSKNPVMFEKMIYDGKIQYFINSLLPELHDSLRMIYSSEQLDWAERNEANIWNHLAEDELLFSNDRMKIRQYTEIAPFTIPLSDVSAPRAASFIGYKIVLSYMKNRPEISVPELLDENDYQKILSGANYHP